MKQEAEQKPKLNIGIACRCGCGQAIHTSIRTYDDKGNLLKEEPHQNCLGVKGIDVSYYLLPVYDDSYQNVIGNKKEHIGKPVYCKCERYVQG